jgi:hypothetical protein
MATPANYLCESDVFSASPLNVISSCGHYCLMAIRIILLTVAALAAGSAWAEKPFEFRMPQ